MRPSLLSEPGGHFRPNLVAALTDPWTDGGMQVARQGAEARAHSVHRRGDNLRRGAPPSGMYGGDGAMAAIHQQNRHAIGRLDGDYRAGPVFQQRVALTQNAAAALGIYHGGGMNLFEGGEIFKPGWNIALARAEAVNQPRQRVELSGTVDLAGILVEHE